MKSQTLPPPAPARDPLPRTAKSSGAVSRSSFRTAAPASHYHMSHRSRMRPVLRVKSSFSSVIRRSSRQKLAAQHCPRHNLFIWASMRISALLNVPLGALRQQQQQLTSTVAPNWHFLRVAGHTRRKKHAARHCLRDNIIPWASMLMSALLNVPLGALRQQQQQSASIFALNWHFLRVVGRTRRKKQAAGHCLRHNLTTWASMLISALLNVPLGRPARPPRGLRQLLQLPGLNGNGNRERAAGRTATGHSPDWMSRGSKCLPMARASRAVLRTRCRAATSSIASVSENAPSAPPRSTAQAECLWVMDAYQCAARPQPSCARVAERRPPLSPSTQSL